jgi:hypothetical protein
MAMKNLHMEVEVAAILCMMKVITLPTMSEAINFEARRRIRRTGRT